MRAAPLLLSLALVAGCTVVRIEDPASGNVQVTQRLGLVSVDVSPHSGAAVVESTSFGVMKSADGVAFGYHASKVAAVAPGDCHLIVWVRSDDDIRSIQQLLRERTDVCVVGDDHSRREDR